MKAPNSTKEGAHDLFGMSHEELSEKVHYLGATGRLDPIPFRGQTCAVRSAEWWREVRRINGSPRRALVSEQLSRRVVTDPDHIRLSVVYINDKVSCYRVYAFVRGAEGRWSLSGWYEGGRGGFCFVVRGGAPKICEGVDSDTLYLLLTLLEYRCEAWHKAKGFPRGDGYYMAARFCSDGADRQ